MNTATKLGAILVRRPYRTAFLRFGCAAAVEHTAVLKSMHYRTVVDIGANRGQFALAARHCLPGANIISFEPLAEAARRYRSLLGGDPGVTLHKAAVGADSREEVMHVSKMDHSSSLLPIGPRQLAVFPGTAEVGTEIVKVVPLATYVSSDDLESPALLKLDVQGYEIEALKGCEDLLDRFASVLVEGSFMELYEGQPLADELIEWLRARGLRLAGVHDAAYDRAGLTIQADFLFTP